jgi:hypothetical protein
MAPIVVSLRNKQRSKPAPLALNLLQWSKAWNTSEGWAIYYVWWLWLYRNLRIYTGITCPWSTISSVPNQCWRRSQILSATTLYAKP